MTQCENPPAAMSAVDSFIHLQHKRQLLVLLTFDIDLRSLNVDLLEDFKRDFSQPEILTESSHSQLLQL